MILNAPVACGPVGREMQELEGNLEESSKLNFLLRRLQSKVSRIPVPHEGESREEREATISRGVWMMGNIRRFFHVHRKALSRAGVTWESVFGHKQAKVLPRMTAVDASGRVQMRLGIAKPERPSLLKRLGSWLKGSARGKTDARFLRRGGARGQ